MYKALKVGKSVPYFKPWHIVQFLEQFHRLVFDVNTLKLKFYQNCCNQRKFTSDLQQQQQQSYRFFIILLWIVRMFKEERIKIKLNFITCA